jgi:saccharopine dehydrogenase-like NADP-dependent oxidoreductase
MDFPRVGTLEAFLTDGLRTLIRTLPIPEMVEKTLRYPGHIELMRVLRATGFFGQEPIEVAGARVRPRDVTARLLFPKWAFEEGEEEFTILRVVVEGQRHGRMVRFTYDLYDEYDRTTGTSSMARTTAFPATIVARLLLSGAITDYGVLPLEVLARHGDLVKRILGELAQRGVHVQSREETL